MTNVEIAESIRNRLFADRNTIEEAWDYASEVINRMKDSEQIAATTALMVLLNTISKEILENESNKEK